MTRSKSESSDPPAATKRQWSANGEHVPRYGYRWKYGELRYNSDALPFAFDYEVYFCEGRVQDIYDPFDRASSADGRPTVPKLLTPPNRSQFTHFPRFVDLRWVPCPGEGNIAYEVELDIETAWQGRLEFRPESKSTTNIPYLPIEFAGDQAGRWRVLRNESSGDQRLDRVPHVPVRRVTEASTDHGELRRDRTASAAVCFGLAIRFVTASASVRVRSKLTVSPMATQCERAITPTTD